MKDLKELITFSFNYHIPETWYSAETLEKLADTSVALSPIGAYGWTIQNMIKTKSSAGFSIDICAIMLFARIMKRSFIKICFYISEPFEKAILIQSIVMVLTQIVLLKLTLRYKELITGSVLPTNEKPIHKSLTDDDEKPVIHILIRWKNRLLKIWNMGLSVTMIFRLFKHIIQLFLIDLTMSFIRLFDEYSIRPYRFWQWRSERKYWKCLLYSVIILSILQLLFGKFPKYIRVLGISSLCLESLTPLPQILLLRHSRSAKGLSMALIVSWLAGDVSRLLYLIFGAADETNDIYLFIIFAILQIVLNVYIFCQYIYYSRIQRKQRNEKSNELPST